MRRTIRIDVPILFAEINEIAEYLASHKSPLNLRKDITFPNELGKDYDLTMYIKSGSFGLEIKFVVSKFKDKNLAVSIVNCENFNDIFTIHSFVFNNGTNEFEVFINTFKEYDKKIYRNKYSYYKDVLDMLDFNLSKSNNKCYKEIVYADFENEENLARASYCVLAYSDISVRSSNISELYETKLNYIGCELKDFYNSKIYCSERTIRDKLDSAINLKVIIKLLIGYISYIKLSEEKSPVRIDKKLISELAKEMYCQYLALL